MAVLLRMRMAASSSSRFGGDALLLTTAISRPFVAIIRQDLRPLRPWPVVGFGTIRTLLFKVQRWNAKAGRVTKANVIHRDGLIDTWGRFALEPAGRGNRLAAIPSMGRDAHQFAGRLRRLLAIRPIEVDGGSSPPSRPGPTDAAQCPRR
jgi:hypothetical protein